MKNALAILAPVYTRKIEPKDSPMSAENIPNIILPYSTEYFITLEPINLKTWQKKYPAS